jgi:hypothetical protein
MWSFVSDASCPDSWCLQWGMARREEADEIRKEAWQYLTAAAKLDPFSPALKAAFRAYGMDPFSMERGERKEVLELVS